MGDARIAVVTGGASGIGRAAALRLARDGDFVVVADVNKAAADDVAAEIRAAGGEAAARMLDVADADAVEAFAAAVWAEHGAVGVLVNSAGILQNPTTVADMPLDEHDRVWAVNYRGTYLCCRAFGARMVAAAGGTIVNIASVAGFRSFPLPAYAPGKAAIVSLTQELAGDFGTSGVRVNAVAPGYVLSPAMKARIDSGHRDPTTMERTTPMGRLILPEEIADGIHFLCSDAARAITGVTLPIDGGWLAGVTYLTYGGIRRN